ncbi:MAG: glycine cleavage T C-terminal barrel domain-containing protein, partial [Alphaproteobacteria bacterium]
VEIKAVVDLRKDPDAGQRGAAVERNGIRILPGHTVWEGQAAKGNRGLTGAAIARVTGEGQCDPTGETLDCDMLCMSVGYTPTAHMLYHAGAKLSYDDETAMMAVRELPEHLFVAGSVNNAFDLSAVVAEGRHAGWSAAKDAGLSVDNEPAVPNTRGSLGQTHPWPIFSHPKGKDFVDFDEDLQVKDLKNGIADGYSHVELLKRFTTSGMGPSQGRHSAINTMRMAARATGEAMADVGTTTSRPPYSAETFGQLAGRSFDPIRLTGIHNRHVELGAQMMVAGDWYRPWYYGPPGKARECAEAESMNVHNNVGVIDVSTLGGLEVQGPDAAEMLNRMYTFTYLKQPLNRARYVLMTDQAGVITDDGVAMRIHDEHFYVTATTSGVGAVYQNMLFWNAQWRLRVNVTNVTTSYAGINIAGPKARKVMEILCPDEDLSIEGWPYMDARVCKVAGIESRVMRIGFVGEPGWEIHCPAEMGETMWDALMETGEPFGIKPFGVEAQRLLRLQKGHIIISQDTDGLTHPYEAGMGWAVSKRKPMFIGGRSLEILEKKPLTRQLVGFVLTSKHAPVPEECHLVIHNGQITGRVTSCYYAPILDQVIGLAYVAPEQAADGTIIQIRVGHSMVDAQVRKPQFYDPENKRQEL